MAEPNEEVLDSPVGWVAKHIRTYAESGGTRMIDEVVYELPLGPLGDLVHVIAVRRDVEGIFRYRNEVIATSFPAESPRGR